MNPRRHTLVIRTPEGIVFSQQLAGPFSRFLAWTIDLAILVLLYGLLSLTLGLLSLLGPGVMRAFQILLYFLLSLGYPMVLEWFWRGQTLGKRLLRLRVVDAQGLRLQPTQIIIRNVLRMVDILPAFYLIGGLATFLTRHAQRLGDVAANTLVVRLPHLAKPDLTPLLPDKYNSLRAYPHLEARLRQRVSADEAALAVQALARRLSLEPEARTELFRDLADLFRARVPFPAEATRDIADEQYVQNVVDVLYRLSNKPHLSRPH